jgi:hypothetical protein
MLDQQRTRPPPRTPDGSTRSAARWATAVAVPVTVLVAALMISRVNGRASTAAPTPATTTPAVMSTTPVTMPAATLPARVRTVCRAVISQLPGSVRDLPQRAVTAGPEQNAAFGDPPITVACGTPAPTVPAESVLMTMDRVCWFTEQRADATVWTAIDREVPVQVTVPTRYEAPAQWANEFSDTIIATVRSTSDVPSGCA